MEVIDVPAWDLSSKLQVDSETRIEVWRTMVRTTSGVMNLNMRRKVAFGGRQRRLEEEGKQSCCHVQSTNSMTKRAGQAPGWHMLGERGSGAPRKVRVFYERKDPQHTLFCRETQYCRDLRAF